MFQKFQIIVQIVMIWKDMNLDVVEWIKELAKNTHFIIEPEELEIEKDKYKQQHTKKGKNTEPNYKDSPEYMFRGEQINFKELWDRIEVLKIDRRYRMITMSLLF